MWEFASLVVATGLISAAWNTGWTFLFDWRRNRFEGAHVALTAAIALERYAIRCWSISYSGEEHHRETGSPLVEAMPELQGMPADEAWKVVDPALADQAMSLANAISVSEVIATHARQFEGNRFNFETEAKERGREAWAIAAELRDVYGLVPREDLRKRLASLLDGPP